jgi:hypothetical protein
MGSKIFSLAALVVGGIILADILIHPAGTQAASQGLAGILTPAESSLLGSAPKS